MGRYFTVLKVVLFAVLSSVVVCKSYGQENNETASEDVKATQAPPVRSRIIAFAPMQGTENGPGFSVSYEQFLDKAKMVSFNVPVILTFFQGGDETVSNSIADHMLYVSPGIKIYPTGGEGMVKYSLGPELVIGAGAKTYDPAYNDAVSDRFINKFTLGILFSNALNINATPRLYMGLNFGFGFSYLNVWDGKNQQIAGLIEGGFKLGYRF